MSKVIERKSVTVLPFTYASGIAPEGYECGDCGVTGVRLYREYQTFLDQQHLRCRKCACENQKKEQPCTSSEHEIGWLVAAVPTEDGTTYWGFTSVPDAGVTWWDQLPKSK